MTKAEYCPLYIRWRKTSENSAFKLHLQYSRAVWKRKKTYFLLAGCSWPVVATILGWQGAKEYGPAVARQTGLSLGRQFWEQLRLALTDFIPPRAYYLYELYRPEQRSRAAEFIHHHEIIELLQVVHDESDAEVFHNKRKFAEACERHLLPTVPILAAFQDGSFAGGRGLGLAEGSDLFAKPACGTCGRGAELWRREPNGGYRSNGKYAENFSGLAEHLAVRSVAEPYILQERVRNHPTLGGLSRGGLCTVRIATCRRPRHRAQFLMAMLRMPGGNELTDNFSAGGLASPIDWSSGVLGEAIGRDLASQRQTDHPATGMPIAGTQMPFWGECVDLCLRAHDTFPRFSSVGWDIAVTENGPLLLEANPVWGVEGLQRAHQRPLGGTALADCILEHIALNRS